jgi:tetratricopeptide (TPR) repeat protein
MRAVGLSTGGEAEVHPAVIADAMAAVLTQAAPANQPLVCIVEDLHHASLELLDLLSRLALRPGVAGALWCTTRPSWVDADELGFETLALGPLATDAITALVGDLHGRGDEGATRSVEEIVAVAGGNPLHAREAAFALQRGESLAAGSTLPELIAARFASYEPPLREALGLAAACGDQFWPEALGRTFLDAVPALYRAGVARARMTSTLTASTEAHFRHPLLREVAYASLDEARRRRLHAELGRSLDAAGAAPEIVAGQAGTAFRLGERAAAPLAARAAADAGRDALDRLSLQAAEEWIALLRDTGDDAEPGLADLLDTELALDRGEYERARALVGAEPDDGPLAARRLVLATRAAYATGDLADAGRYGARALELLSDAPREAAAHAVTYGIVLSRTGSHEEALALLDQAADDARVVGDRGLAARLAAEAADVAHRLQRLRGTYVTEAIERTRRALAEQRDAGDVRRYIASAPAFVETLAIDAPEEALEIAIDAAEKALALGDLASVGALAISICDTALDAESPGALERWLPYLASSPLDAIRQIEAAVLQTTARAARSDTTARIDGEMLAFADRYAALGDVNRADMPEMAAISSLAWSGAASAARRTFEDRVRHRLPSHLTTLYELALRALEGPPWPLNDVALPEITMVHNERALLHLLRGEDDVAQALLRERFEDRRRTSGSRRQRFGPLFPGALVAALGPADTEPDLEWLLGWIHRPPFPGLWVAHRAICALLLSERAEPPEPGLASVARRLIESTSADESVREWIRDRAGI